MQIGRCGDIHEINIVPLADFFPVLRPREVIYLVRILLILQIFFDGIQLVLIKIAGDLDRGILRKRGKAFQRIAAPDTDSDKGDTDVFDRGNPQPHHAFLSRLALRRRKDVRFDRSGGCGSCTEQCADQILESFHTSPHIIV